MRMHGHGRLAREAIGAVADGRSGATGTEDAEVSDATYRVFQQDDDSFAVEIARSGALAQLATGFATEAEAADWIAQDKRLWDAADPFRTAPGRKRHGW
jgi:hypothetical protein